ncbi:hypothetical protein HK098_003960 [Nowakowskiella sp. JEL0407]|nr:hypothetical protein HK098_003960 [Nowakowskiella sp. JEL0407]
MDNTKLRKITLDGKSFFGKFEFLQSLSGSSFDRWVSAEFSNLLSTITSTTLPSLITTNSKCLPLLSLLNLQPTITKLTCILPSSPYTPTTRIKLLNGEILQTQSNAHPSSPEFPENLANRVVSEMGGKQFTLTDDVIRVEVEKFCDEIKSQVEAESKESKVDAIVLWIEYDTPDILLQRVKKKFGNECKIIGVVNSDSGLSASSESPLNPKSGLPKWIASKNLDEVKLVSFNDALKCARRLNLQGVYCGVRSGAVCSVVKDLDANNVVCILDDSWNDYEESLKNVDYLATQNLLTTAEEQHSKVMEYRGASIEDLQLPEAVSIPKNCKIEIALEIMISRDFSQLPVIDNHRKMIGWVSLGSLQSHISDGSLKNPNVEEISSWMYTFNRKRSYQIITPDTLLSDLDSFWENHTVAFVTDQSGKFPLAVVTKFDILKFKNHRAKLNALY